MGGNLRGNHKQSSEIKQNSGEIQTVGWDSPHYKQKNLVYHTNHDFVHRVFIF